MDKTFNPSDIETKWYQTWETNGHFKPSGQGESYCIMIPPPNVTGSLHMGHAFQDTIMDTLIRYHRMQGHNTLWQVGTDHAGIATQMVVERQLMAQDMTRHDLGREKFLQKVWEWKAQSGGTITKQLRRMGASVDWSRERFTMDDGLSNAVKEVFVRLYEDGLIYRGKRLVNWDPKLHTAISDLEVENQDEKGFLWHFRYPLANGATTAEGKNYIVVATTRPETMLGDTAVAVNPKDERYQALIGQTVVLPLVNREIPIIADDYVDMEFGTGCVKITPAHDFNDYEVGKRHNLPLVNILTIDAAIREEAEVFNIDGSINMEVDPTLPEQYRGEDRFAARKKIVAEFEALGLLENIDDHALKVPRGDRSGVVVEPFLTDQWYVRVAPLAEPAIKAVENGDIQFVPKQWENTYFAWMRDIQDWCISRQLWWGHRIPAWYDNEGNVYVGRDVQEIRKKHNLDEHIALHQDEDVLDTWFSSALWTFSTLGWPEQTPELKTFHPTNVLVTGFDIIFFWVARMIMMTLKFMDDVPFRKVYVHGLVRDAEGQKMSKSKGNVLDPLDIIDGIELEELVSKRTGGMMQPKLAAKIEKQTRKHYPDGIASYGTDALRFTFLSMAATGRDIKFDTGRLEGYRNFCNKIWNAARYVLMNTEGQDNGLTNTEVELSLADRWIISRLQQTEAQVTKATEEYRFDHAAQALYEFVWNEYCDWFLELSKPILTSDMASDAAKRGTRRTLLRVLETILRMAHPMMPYISEEIWQTVAPMVRNDLPEGASIMQQAYPRSVNDDIDEQAIADIEWVKGVIVGVRNIRGEMNISPAKQVPVLLHNGNQDDQRRYQENEQFLKSLAKLESITWLNGDEDVPMSATQLVGNMEVLVPMAGLIDKAAEIARLNKEIDKLNNEVTRVEKKLANPSFVDKAPAEVVAKEKAKMEEAKSALGKLIEQRDKIDKL